MSKTSLNQLIGKHSLSHHVASEQWPIPDQFVGLEIEIENPDGYEMRAHQDKGSPYWDTHQDGSLRNGIEYVLREPQMGSQLSEAISYWFRNFKNYTAGPRTSIHVHLNMRQDSDTMDALKNLLVLYYMYEEAFFRIADFNRKWCAYCNPFEDNPPQILVDVLRYDEKKVLPKTFAMQLHQSAGRNQNRYYGLNINALHRFGTLEFRHFPLVYQEEKLVDWISLIMEFKLAARRLADEGLKIHDFIQSPDDVFKLRDYLPRVWEIVNGYVDSQKAYVRMINVNGLTLDITQQLGDTMGGNHAWKRFLNEQTSRGKEISPAPPPVKGRGAKFAGIRPGDALVAPRAEPRGARGAVANRVGGRIEIRPTFAEPFQAEAQLDVNGEPVRIPRPGQLEAHFNRVWIDEQARQDGVAGEQALDAILAQQAQEVARIEEQRRLIQEQMREFVRRQTLDTND